MIDPKKLVSATNCTIENATKFAPEISNTILKWQITNIPQFIAQMAAESLRFSRTVEDLYYTTPQRLIEVWPTRFRLPLPWENQDQDKFGDGKRNARRYICAPYKLAEFTYGGRMGNRQEGSGDGHKFIGRGLKMLTGFDNYYRYRAASHEDVINYPKRLEQPRFAADSAGWFWTVNNLNGVHDVTLITRRVTGDPNDRDTARRMEMTDAARTVIV